MVRLATRRRLLLFSAFAMQIGGQRIDYAEAGGPYVPEKPTAPRQAVPSVQTRAPTAASAPMVAPVGAPVAATTAAVTAPAVAVVAPPTTTVTQTTTDLTLIPSAPEAVLQPGLVGEIFDFKTKQRTVAVIDKTVHHWGDLYSALAMKWKGLLYIRSYGRYRFQITCLGAAELRIDGVVILKEDTLSSDKTSFASRPVVMAEGYHDILIGYTELEGQAGFAINYLGPDTAGVLKLIPPGAYFHKQGPCDLRDIVAADSIACGTKDAPRWALASGESCEVRCSWGRYPNGIPGSQSLVTCQNGLLSPADFRCSLRSCALPKVSGAGDKCGEGAFVPHGQRCTPTCMDGFETEMSIPLECRNGTMSGQFSCKPMRSCSAPDPKHIENVGDPVCLHGTSVLHGARCGAGCAPGYEPTVDPICKDGLLEPQAFACRKRAAVLETTQPLLAYQASAAWSTTPLAGPPMLGAAPGPGGAAAGPLVALVAALAVAVVSAGACFCMAYSGTAKKRQSRGVQLSDSRPHSISTDYSGFSASDLEGRNHSDYSSEDDDDSPPPSPPMRPQAQNGRAQASSQKLLEERRLAESRRLEEQKQHAEAERRRASERAKQQREHEHARQQQPTERILGTSVRPLPPSHLMHRIPAHGQHRYAEDKGSDWSDVRAGDRHPRKANHVPWSDIRLS